MISDDFVEDWFFVNCVTDRTVGMNGPHVWIEPNLDQNEEKKKNWNCKLDNEWSSTKEDSSTVLHVLSKN